MIPKNKSNKPKKPKLRILTVNQVIIKGEKKKKV